MEVSVKFNSHVRGEVLQFELIWCLQGVYKACRLSNLQATGQKMSKQPVNVKHTLIHHDPALALQSLVVDFSCYILHLLLSLQLHSKQCQIQLLSFYLHLAISTNQKFSLLFYHRLDERKA